MAVVGGPPEITEVPVPGFGGIMSFHALVLSCAVCMVTKIFGHTMSHGFSVAENFAARFALQELSLGLPAQLFSPHLDKLEG